MASHSAKPTAACLVAAYTPSPRVVRSPAIEAVVTRWPSPRANHPGSRARAAYTWAIRFTRHWLSQVASGVSGPAPPPSPALATQRPTGPIDASPSATRATVAPSSVTSSRRDTTSAEPPPSTGDSRSAAITALAPAPASARTSAPPMPPAAPVTTAMRPFGSMRRNLPGGPESAFNSTRCHAELSPSGANASPMDDTTTTWLSWRYELMHDFTIVVLLGLGLWKVVDLLEDLVPGLTRLHNLITVALGVAAAVAMKYSLFTGFHVVLRHDWMGQWATGFAIAGTTSAW